MKRLAAENENETETEREKSNWKWKELTAKKWSKKC
jgi:hypothetical protein